MSEAPDLLLLPSWNAVAHAATIVDLTSTYSRLVDDLALMVEAEARRSAQSDVIIASALDELHTALNELVCLIRKGAL